MNALVERINDLQIPLDGFEGNVNRAVLRNIVNMNTGETDNYNNTQLHLLLYNLKLDEDVVRDLLNSGGSVNAVNDTGKTPLHYALQYKNCQLSTVKLLVSRGADLNKSDYAGFVPLTHALLNDHYCSIDVIKFLCDNGADVKAIDGLGCTLLHQASMSRKWSLEVFKMLLDKGVSAHKVNLQGETALHVAVVYSRKDVVEFLLNIPNMKVNLFNRQRCTPLHLAVRNPKIDPGIIEVLLKAGAIIDKKTHQDQQCLHLAARHCNPTVIKLLLDYGARVNVYDKNKLSPLDIAVIKSQHCDIAALKALLDAGALIFPNKRTKKNMNPQDQCPTNTKSALHEAVRFLNIEKRYNVPHKLTQQVLLLLKYAALEKPRLCFQNMQADNKLKPMLMAYNQKCMEELKTVCIAPNVTLAQFILRSSLLEDGECPTKDILEILSARPYPIYKEVVAGLMDRDDLRDGLQQHPVYALNKNKPDERAVLDYYTLSGVMIYLSEEDLLNLLLAVFEPRSPVPQIKRCCDCGIYEDIEAESEKFHKRARIV